MALSVKITDIVEKKGRVYVRFGKHELEFASRQEMLDYAKSKLDENVMQALAIALIAERAADFGAAKLDAVRNKTLSVDLSKASWGTVS